ncbi:hypothetical protein [Pseudomonas citri]|uniref:hypothetical protein n=1 Tax=Pseudomonas citri TaxID=2978349 RepID=UPI0021B5F986|nr:hypothetical protein [Pseudomonas citri]
MKKGLLEQRIAHHATGPCDNLARAPAGKLDRRQAANHPPGHSLAPHQKTCAPNIH